VCECYKLLVCLGLPFLDALVRGRLDADPLNQFTVYFIDRARFNFPLISTLRTDKRAAFVRSPAFRADAERDFLFFAAGGLDAPLKGPALYISGETMPSAVTDMIKNDRA
jgi:hypothetical protein